MGHRLKWEVTVYNTIRALLLTILPDLYPKYVILHHVQQSEKNFPVLEPSCTSKIIILTLLYENRVKILVLNFFLLIGKVLISKNQSFSPTVNLPTIKWCKQTYLPLSQQSSRARHWLSYSLKVQFIPNLAIHFTFSWHAAFSCYGTIKSHDIYIFYYHHNRVFQLVRKYWMRPQVKETLVST